MVREAVSIRRRLTCEHKYTQPEGVGDPTFPSYNTAVITGAKPIERNEAAMM